MDLPGEQVADLLEALGITHVVWLPDSALGPWETALDRPGRLKLVRVCREGEAWAIAAGLHLGGRRPLVVIQNTGLFESGDALRNVLFDLKLPLLAVIGYRSYLVEGSQDSARRFTEPILKAWGLDYTIVENPQQLPAMAEHFRRALDDGRPAVVLVAEGPESSSRPREPASSTSSRQVILEEPGTVGEASGFIQVSRHVSAIPRMPLVPALEALVRLRGERIVVTTMGAAREWPKLGDHPLDFHYVPSAMGEAPALGLGLALAQPASEVLVVNGDGGMLMNIGSLVTIVASGAKNITVVVLDNGIYEVTGGQQTATTIARRHAGVSYTRLAEGAGFRSAIEYQDLNSWRAAAAGALDETGPRFISLAVEPVGPEYHLTQPGPLAQRLARFRQAIADRFM